MPKRRRLTAGERRNQLVEVGRAVFAEQGYDAASVEEIAVRAGISKPVIYEHFGGKEGLYAVIVDREMDYVIGTIAEAISEGSSRERLTGGVQAFFLYVRDHPDGFAVLSRDAPGSGMANLLDELASRITEVFELEFERVGYNSDAAPLYARGAIGMVTFIGQWWRDNPELSVEEVSSHVLSLAWLGLRHLPNEPPG